MASEEYLIRNTTQEQRKKIVQESLGVTDGLCDGYMQGIIDRYDDYIYGRKELEEINASFMQAYGYNIDDGTEKNRGSCGLVE